MTTNEQQAQPATADREPAGNGGVTRPPQRSPHLRGSVVGLDWSGSPDLAGGVVPAADIRP